MGTQVDRRWVRWGGAGIAGLVVVLNLALVVLTLVAL